MLTHGDTFLCDSAISVFAIAVVKYRQFDQFEESQKIITGIDEDKRVARSATRLLTIYISISGYITA